MSTTRRLSENITWYSVVEFGGPLFNVIPSTAADEAFLSGAGSRWRVFEFPISEPFLEIEITPTRLSRDPLSATQSKDGRFRFGNLLPAAVGACAPTLPFRKLSALIFVAFSRLRFDWHNDVMRGFPFMTSSTGRLPVVSVGSPDGGDLRLIFMRIPLSTMVA